LAEKKGGVFENAKSEDVGGDGEDEEWSVVFAMAVDEVGKDEVGGDDGEDYGEMGGVLPEVENEAGEKKGGEFEFGGYTLEGDVHEREEGEEEGGGEGHGMSIARGGGAKM